jgi:hypothetical protein
MFAVSSVHEGDAPIVNVAAQQLQVLATAYPIGTMDLGTDSEYSRIRIPMPPQKRTTFIRVSP